MKAFWLKRLGHHICHIALHGHMAGVAPCRWECSQSGRPDECAWCPWSGWDWLVPTCNSSLAAALFV